MLPLNPCLIGGGRQGEKTFAAYPGDGVAGDQGEERLPLESRCVEMRDWGRGQDKNRGKNRGGGWVCEGIHLGHDFVMVAPPGSVCRCDTEERQSMRVCLMLGLSRGQEP